MVDLIARYNAEQRQNFVKVFKKLNDCYDNDVVNEFIAKNNIYIDFQKYTNLIQTGGSDDDKYHRLKA